MLAFTFNDRVPQRQWVFTHTVVLHPQQLVMPFRLDVRKFSTEVNNNKSDSNDKEQE